MILNGIDERSLMPNITTKSRKWEITYKVCLAVSVIGLLVYNKSHPS